MKFARVAIIALFMSAFISRGSAFAEVKFEGENFLDKDVIAKGLKTGRHMGAPFDKDYVMGVDNGPGVCWDGAQANKPVEITLSEDGGDIEILRDGQFNELGVELSCLIDDIREGHSYIYNGNFINNSYFETGKPAMPVRMSVVRGINSRVPYLYADTPRPYFKLDNSSHLGGEEILNNIGFEFYMKDGVGYLKTPQKNGTYNIENSFKYYVYSHCDRISSECVILDEGELNKATIMGGFTVRDAVFEDRLVTRRSQTFTISRPVIIKGGEEAVEEEKMPETPKEEVLEAEDNLNVGSIEAPNTGFENQGFFATVLAGISATTILTAIFFKKK